jgi:hypothetical protein
VKQIELKLEGNQPGEPFQRMEKLCDIFPLYSFLQWKGKNLGLCRSQLKLTRGGFAMEKNIQVLRLCGMLLLVFLLGACSEFSSKASDTPDGLTKIEIINDDNRHLVGKKLYITSVKVHPADQDIGSIDWTFPDMEIPVEIPDNPIANQDLYPGRTIQIVKIDGSTTPELIGPNGAIGVFALEDNAGWYCQKGDILAWSFEKHPLDEHGQAIAVGYAKDGVVNKYILYQNKRDGTYELNVPEDGYYYIYFIYASSDPISLAEGQIQIR